MRLVSTGKNPLMRQCTGIVSIDEGITRAATKFLLKEIKTEFSSPFPAAIDHGARI